MATTPHSPGETPSPHKLTANEEREWERIKNQPNTRADWEDLNDTIVAYRRRWMGRHRTAQGGES